MADYGNDKQEPKKRKKGLNDQEVLTLVEAKVRRGVGFHDSKISSERERVTKYENLALPARQAPGRSSYVSSDVHDSVEALKAQMLDTFGSNQDNLVSFRPQGPEDVEGARDATDYCAYQIFQLNNGFDVFQHVIDDGLKARVGITKVYWEKHEEEVEEEFEGLDFETVQGMAAREDIVELDATEQPILALASLGIPGSFAGSLTRKVDRSKVCLDPVPPEEFIVESSTKTIAKSGMVSQACLKTKAELIEMGYPKEVVEKINWKDARSLDLAPEVQARRQAFEDGAGTGDDEIQPELAKVMYYETYVRMNMKDGKGVRLWQVCHAGNILLNREEVDRAPFIAFVPLPIAHSFYGKNFAALVIPTQNARTGLMRAILDHASVTTNPRYGVVKGGLLNPKEMLDNRLGGIVNLNRPDAVRPIEQQPLNPFVFQTQEVLKANNEERTGISALSQGMNKEAISTQNSDDLISRLVTLSQQRQKTIARNFVYGYLIPLYLEVYRLVLENEKTEKIIEVTGRGFRRMDPQRWVERTDIKTAIHVGYGDREKQSKKHMAAYTALASDPALGPAFSYENRYAMIMDGFRIDGSFDNYMAYLTPPEKVKPPQPDPLAVKELEIKDKQAQASMISAQASAQKIAIASMDAMSDRELDEMKTHIDTVFKAREADRQDADVANRIDVSQREMALAESAPQGDQNVIVSANS